MVIVPIEIMDFINLMEELQNHIQRCKELHLCKMQNCSHIQRIAAAILLNCSSEHLKYHYSPLPFFLSSPPTLPLPAPQVINWKWPSCSIVKGLTPIKPRKLRLLECSPAYPVLLCWRYYRGLQKVLDQIYCTTCSQIPTHSSMTWG